jgi:hypothetical protein
VMCFVRIMFMIKTLETPILKSLYTVAVISTGIRFQNRKYFNNVRSSISCKRLGRAIARHQLVLSPGMMTGKEFLLSAVSLVAIPHSSIMKSIICYVDVD